MMQSGQASELVVVDDRNLLNASMRGIYKRKAELSSPAPQVDVETPNKTPSQKPAPKKRPKVTRPGEASAASRTPRPTVRYNDVGGVETILKEARELIEWPLRYPDVCIDACFGVDSNKPIGVRSFGCESTTWCFVTWATGLW